MEVRLGELCFNFILHFPQYKNSELSFCKGFTLNCVKSKDLFLNEMDLK
jgi:hypothetical protein